MQHLLSRLERLEGRPFPAYRDLVGPSYELPGPLHLQMVRVSGDPYAPPAQLKVVCPPSFLRWPDEWTGGPVRQQALLDFLYRRLFEALEGQGRPSATRSGFVLSRPSQARLVRSALSLEKGSLVVRLRVHLPADGRRIRGREARALLSQRLADLLRENLPAAAQQEKTVLRWLELAEDQGALRQQLEERGLIAFVGDDSLLARRHGGSDRPLTGPGVVPFRSPDSLAVTLSLPHRGEIRGMGIPPGVTVIVGGGYQGKTTLLAALAQGVYDHIPEDGRELVAMDPAATFIRAEDGRCVIGLDLSPFLRSLPGADPRLFTTENASGSTSQAAAFLESLELGSRVLLCDEDTSATNFLLRDSRMRALVPDTEEVLIPLRDRIDSLKEQGVSLLLVTGGNGTYLDVADRVIRMQAYRASDVTSQAREVCARIPEVPWPREAPLPPRPRREVDTPALASLLERQKVRFHPPAQVTIGERRIHLDSLITLREEGQGEALLLLLSALARRPALSPADLPRLFPALREALADRWTAVEPRPTDVGALLLRIPTLPLR